MNLISINNEIEPLALCRMAEYVKCGTPMVMQIYRGPQGVAVLEYLTFIGIENINPNNPSIFKLLKGPKGLGVVVSETGEFGYSDMKYIRSRSKYSHYRDIFLEIRAQ